MTHADADQLKHDALALLPVRQQLPIWAARKRLVRLIEANSTVVLAGETGSGKTTQAPQFVLHALAPAGTIACTQPRRVAAITVAQRVAAEQGCAVGDKVGYAVRFDDRTGAATRLKYMTDGLLIREATGDPRLSSYSVVFVDEAHERSLNSDIVLGILKRAQAQRAASPQRGKHAAGPLKVVVMSATIQQQAFVDFFPGAVAAHVPGRQHDIEVFFTQAAQESYLRATVNAVLQVGPTLFACASNASLLLCPSSLRFLTWRHTYLPKMPKFVVVRAQA